MQFPPTYILRHRKENLKKCSLRGLETREGIQFLTYPWKVEVPNLQEHVVLSMEGPLLSEADQKMGIFLIDGTWRYANKMEKTLPLNYTKRSLPKGIETAYPRRQLDCPDPKRGLASIEALFVAYLILGRDVRSLLSNYSFANQFLENLKHATDFPICESNLKALLY